MGCSPSRIGTHLSLYVLELNPIAEIVPCYWLPKSADVANLNYDRYINTILDIALERIHSNHS